MKCAIMRRRDLLIVSAASVWAQASRGETPRPPVVGVLSNSSPDLPNQQWGGYVPQALRDLGYVEGQNIRFEYRAAGGDIDRLPVLATELVNAGVTVIVSYATPATRAAQKATTTVPIVGLAMGDPVADGLVASLGSPGGNVTGNTFLGPELVPKRLGYLKELLPSLTRAAVLWQPQAYGEQTMNEMLKEVQQVAAALGIALKFAAISGPPDFEAASHPCRAAALRR